LVRENWAKAKGRKPYVAGEFGFVATPAMEATLDAVIETGTAGALVWSLRFRNRDGGFYWHSEPAGGNQYKAYHWPGFPSGAEYDEIHLLALMRRRAFAIRGLSAPAIPVPKPPRLLPIRDAAAVSWQGTVGATSYLVERALGRRGPWTVAGKQVDETAVQYRPLFADAEAGPGRWYYRVRARNATGTSAPSNVVGPVTVTHGTLVDELVDFSSMARQSGPLELKNRGNARPAKEDAHRLAGTAGSALVYLLPGAIRTWTLFGYFPQEPRPFRFAVSTDGVTFSECPADQTVLADGAGDCGYWKPVRCRGENWLPGARYLRVEFGGEAQVGRLEVVFEKPEPRPLPRTQGP
jgi:hypothetical protein